MNLDKLKKYIKVSYVSYRSIVNSNDIILDLNNYNDILVTILDHPSGHLVYSEENHKWQRFFSYPLEQWYVDLPYFIKVLLFSKNKIKIQLALNLL